MQYRHHRQVEAHHRADLAAPGAGGVDDDLGGDVALFGVHLPLAAARAPYPHNGVVPVDFRTAVARASGHGVGGLTGVHMAVPRFVDGTEQTFGLHQGIDLLQLTWIEDVKIKTRERADALHLPELVHAIAAARDPQRAAGVETYRLAGLVFEHGLVQAHAVGAHVHDGEVVREMGAQTGRVPGRPRRELVLFHQDAIVPTEFGQVVQQ